MTIQSVVLDIYSIYILCLHNYQDLIVGCFFKFVALLSYALFSVILCLNFSDN